MITILSGSARSNSNTLKVAKAVQHIVQASGKEASIIDFHAYDVPNFNQDFDPESLSEWQQHTIASMSKAQVIFVLSPEYNWCPSAEVLTFLNRFGSKQFAAIWDNKTFATIGVSAGIGGRMPAVQLCNVINKIISFIDVSSNTISAIQEVHHVAQVIDDEGQLKDNEQFNSTFKKFVLSAIH